MARENDTESKDITYFLTYLLLWITGLIILLTKAKENKRFKFHAFQAILLGVVSAIIAILFTIVGAGGLSALISFILWIYGLYIGYMAYLNEDKQIPYLANYAKTHSEYLIKKPEHDESRESAKEQHAKKKAAAEEETDEEEDHIKTLKKRYAKGEITRKQYLKMKKELEE